MRRFNAILAMLTLALFVIHGVMGALNLMNVAPLVSKGLSYTMLTLIALHACISVFYTVKTIVGNIRTKAPYLRQNRLFWARRISGVMIMVMIFFHLTAFDTAEGGVFRLLPFDGTRLTAQLLLVASVAVHIITNVKPALIAFGVRRLKPRAGDVLFFLSAALLFMAAGFIIYYIRWHS